MAPTTLLDQPLVQVMLRPRNEPVSWLISRLASRTLQIEAIGSWNKTGSLPDNIENMPRLTPGGISGWRRAAL
jgi:hypothetical protein